MVIWKWVISFDVNTSRTKRIEKVNILEKTLMDKSDI